MAISGTMETPMPAPTMLRRLLNWPLSKTICGWKRARVELVFLGERGKEPLGQQGNSFEFMATQGKRQDGDVDGAGSETAEKDWRDLLDDSESNLREFAREGSEVWREEVRGDGGNHADGVGTSDELFTFDDVTLGGFQFAKDGVGSREKRLAQLGKPNGAAEAVEEARAEFGFQLEDLLGKRRLGNVRLFRGAAERTGFGHCAEVTKLVEFHTRTSYQ